MFFERTVRGLTVRGKRYASGVFDKHDNYLGKVYKTVAKEWKNSVSDKTFKSQSEAVYDLRKRTLGA